MSRDIDERCWWCDEDLEGQVLTEHIKKHPVTKFEAEVSSMVSVAGFCDHFCCDLPANVCRVRTLAREIERFLADERERVREMCANAGSQRAGELRDLLKTIEESCGPCDVDAETERLRMENRAEELELVAAGIRQLDLTEDLAPSSTEEGKGND